MSGAFSRVARAVGKPLRSAVGEAAPLAMLERRYLSDAGRPVSAPVFIIGAPRSGSTLLYQLVAYYFRCAYLSNVASVFPAAPALATRGLVGGRRYEDASFSSDYGLARGFTAPSEAGRVLHRWFGAGGDPELPVRTVARLEQVMGGPFVWKNLNLAFHLDELSERFPDAFFLRIVRDPAFICQSILIGLRRGDVGNVPGVMERGVPGDAVEQVAAGVSGLERRISDFLAASPHPHHTVAYEALCAEPHQELLALQAAYARTGSELVLHREFTEHRFPAADRVRLPAEEWTHLQAVLGASPAEALR